MNDERVFGPEEPPMACGGGCANHRHSLALSEDVICPLTGEPHVWADWERVVEQMWGGEPGDMIPTGDRARECKVCGRWQVEWAE